MNRTVRFPKFGVHCNNNFESTSSFTQEITEQTREISIAHFVLYRRMILPTHLICVDTDTDNSEFITYPTFGPELNRVVK